MDYREYKAMIEDEDNSLEHFGVLGMHWGIRKEEEKSNKSNKPYSIDEVAKLNKKALKINPNANLVDWEAESKRSKKLTEEENKKRKKIIRNVAIGVGATLLVAGGTVLYLKNKDEVDSSVKNFFEKFGDKKVAGLLDKNTIKEYSKSGIKVETEQDAKIADFFGGFYNHDLTRYNALKDSDIAAKSSKDILINAGETITRIKRTPSDAIHDGAYAAFEKNDVDRYKVFLPTFWNKNRAVYPGSKTYSMTMAAKEALKVSSPRKQYDVYLDMIKEEFKDGLADPVEYAKKNYPKFSTELIYNSHNTGVMGYSKEFQEIFKRNTKYFEKMKSLGYDAIIDENDAGRLSNAPIILLNSAKVAVKEVTENSASVISKAISEMELSPDENLGTITKMINSNTNISDTITNGINHIVKVAGKLTN